MSEKFYAIEPWGDDWQVAVFNPANKAKTAMGVAEYYRTFNKREDAVAALELVKTETAPLREEIATLQAALEAQSQKIAELASNYANLYAENTELKKIAEGLAELEDIAADLADNLPGDKTTVNAVTTTDAQNIAELRQLLQGVYELSLPSNAYLPDNLKLKYIVESLETTVNTVSTTDAQNIAELEAARSATVALETPARKFADGDTVMVATHGIGATFFHKAFIEDAILGMNYSGKPIWLYAIRYTDTQKIRIDVNEYDVKPYPGDKQ